MLLCYPLLADLGTVQTQTKVSDEDRLTLSYNS